MKNLKLNNFLLLATILSVLTFIFLDRDKDYSFAGLYEKLSNVTLVLGLMFAFFVKFAWRWSIFNGWLVPFPDLSGTWEGELISDRSGSDPIGATLIIRQSFLFTRFLLTTENSRSISFAESFQIDDETNEKLTVFSYLTEPNVLQSDANPRHCGTAKLRFTVQPYQLSGSYWTDRKTRGEMLFRFIPKVEKKA